MLMLQSSYYNNMLVGPCSAHADLVYMYLSTRTLALALLLAIALICSQETNIPSRELILLF